MFYIVTALERMNKGFGTLQDARDFAIQLPYDMVWEIRDEYDEVIYTHYDNVWGVKQ